MEGILAVAFVALIVLGPIVAFVMALRALNRTVALERELRAQQGRLEVLARRLRVDWAEGSRGTSQPASAPETLVSPEPLLAPESPSAPEPLSAPSSSAAPEGFALSASVDESPHATVEDAGTPPPLPLALPRPARPEAPSGPPSASSVAPASRSINLESLLGGSLLVWVGGIALALAGAFLVKYSLDQGYLSPPVRVALGVGFGLALIAVGEWMRLRGARVAQAACAAGVAVIFAALLAATNLYALIPPLAGFLALGVTTAAAVVLSLRHGPFVAGLGLMGGFLTPALLRAEMPSPPMLFGYLFALQLGLLFVARSRGWWPLALLTILGVHGWSFAFLAGMSAGAHEPWLALFALASTAATVLLTLGGEAQATWGAANRQQIAPVIGWLGGLLGLITSASVVRAGAFSNMEWGFLLLLAAGALALAFFDERYAILPWLTAGAGVMLLFDWSQGAVPIAGRFALIAAVFGALHVVGAFLLAMRSKSPRLCGALSAAATVAFLLVTWNALPAPPQSLLWGGLALLLALAHAAAVAFLLRDRDGTRECETRIAAHAVGTTILTSLAIGFELEREWIAVAWALQLPALAWLDRRLRLLGLRVLGAAVLILVAARLLVNPAVLDYPIGEMPIFDWLLWAYLVPSLCCVIAARLHAKVADDRLVFGLEIGAIAFAAAWVALETRHLFHPSNIGSSTWTLAELGWISSLFLAGGAALALVGADREREGLRIGGHALALAGLPPLTLGSCLAFNPLWANVGVAGSPFLNTLLIAYALPAALLAAWAVLLRRRASAFPATVAAASAVLLTFLFVSLEVRHCFHGTFLNTGEVGNGELYAYSAVWMLLGIALLLAGLRCGSRPLRQAALAVMVITVGKVFLLDMSELEDLWRVLSFFGLGVILLLLGYLYQRFVPAGS